MYCRPNAPPPAGHRIYIYIIYIYYTYIYIYIVDAHGVPDLEVVWHSLLRMSMRSPALK
jgi:hypothetical protein